MASFQPPSHLFERNISLNDLDSALDVREIVRKDVVVPEDVTKHRYLDSSSNYTFVLPSFRDFSLEFRKFVFSFLVDGHIMRELEAAKRLNWCSTLGRMVTVSTLGDGNCLMHAASIGMWAVNDRYQTLRKTVHEALVEDVEGFYHGRWKAEEEREILNQHGGYQRTEEQWDHEWEEVIRLVSQNEFPLGPNGAQFGSLEEIHIFVLANILRRTIIVMSDDTLRGPYGDSYSPINFGGVYLPLLWDSVDCVKSPLVIGYANGHFTAVVSIQDGKLDLEVENQPPSSSTKCVHAVPLVKYNGSPLPVHFLLDHEVPLANDRVRQYLDCAKVPFSSDQGEPRYTILVAKLHFGEEPRCMKALIEGYFQRAREEYQRMLRTSQVNAQSQPGTKQPALQIVQCQTPGCTFYGSTETGNRCSQCLNEYLRNLGPSEPSRQRAVRQISSQQNFVTTTSSPTPQAPNAFVTTVPTTFPATTSAKCRTSGCKYAAVSNHGGLCERCFEAERNAEEMAASMNPMTLATTKHCANRVNGCEFFGLPEHHNLCSRCYRTFCLQMENTLATLPQTGLKPHSPALPGQPNSCQSHNCPYPGVPALYGMCVQCYTGCIHSFITSKGASVGSAVQPSPPQHAPLQNITRMNPVPTGGRRKGVLCASPGCFNEGISQFSDLCRECHVRKSGPSPQVRNTPVSTAREASVPLTTRSPSSASAAAAAAAASNHHLTSAPTRSGSTAVTVSRVSGYPLPAFTSSRTNSNITPGTSSSVGAQHPYQVTLPQAPSTESRTDKCALCRKQAELDGGLCKDCFAAGFQAELRNIEKRQVAVSQTLSRQQGTFAAASSNNQGAQRTSQGMNQTETATGTAKKMAVKVTELPCTTTGCLRFGTPEKNGLCEQCYPSERRIRRGSSTEAHQNQGPGLRDNLRNSPTPTQNRQFGYDLPEPVQVSQPQYSLYAPHARQSHSNSGSDDISGQKCRGANCTLFGTPETNGFCSQCFLDSTIPLSYPHSVPDFPTTSRPAAVVQRCTVTGCDRTAAPERHGHCQDCFGMYYPDVLSRESFLNNCHT